MKSSRLTMAALAASTTTFLAVIATSIAGCSLAGSEPAADDTSIFSSDSVQKPSSPLFATQAAAAGEREVFEGLYEGAVLEQQGCLRLDSDSAHTVVWPPGFELRTVDDRYRVLDEGGMIVGTVGERFRLGGGELPRGAAPELADSELLRELLARCPGPYWLAGDIMPHPR